MLTGLVQHYAGNSLLVVVSGFNFPFVRENLIGKIPSGKLAIDELIE